MKNLKKRIKKSVMFLAAVLVIQSLCHFSSVNAGQAAHWFSQKGLSYQGKKLTSMCYITCYAMILKNLGIETDPVSVYVANGYSNYANHSKIGTAYNVDTSEKGSLSGLSVAKKKEKIRELLEEHPEGIIVGGCYSGSSYHYIVAIKADDKYIYFDDPAYETEDSGCCIKLENTWKLTWNNLSMYRIIKKNEVEVTKTATPAPATIEPTQTVNAATQTPVVSASVNPTATPAPTANSTNVKDYKVPVRSIYLKNPIMKGEDVKWVQAALYTLEYDILVDGSFGAKSKKTVKLYQKDNKLTVDGCVGSGTRKALIFSLNKKEIKESLKKVKKMSATNSEIASNNMYTSVISWKEQSAADGYQIVYADNADFKSKKQKKVSKNSVKLTKLSPNKTYYIKTRAYGMVDNVKVYGKYSSIIKVKVTK